MQIWFKIFKYPNFPPIKDNYKYTLILDLDETLIYLQNKDSTEALTLRPNIHEFLHEMKSIYELILFSENSINYVGPILDIIQQKENYFEHILCKEYITLDKKGQEIKDLNLLGRDLKNIIVVDNMKQYYKNKDNLICIKSFFGDTNNDNKSSENLSKNNTITNVNQNKITPNPPIIPPIKSPVISSIKDPSSSKIPLDNDSNLNLSDKKSHTTKEEISKRSESKTSSSKFPFQPLKDIITSPKTDRKISFNSNISNSDNYLPSHLGEYIRNESTPNPISIQDIMNQKKGKGFKCYSQITLAGREADGKLKTNQDTPLVCISVGGIVGFNMFGVLDGHGPQGHFVSQFCKDYFIRNMKTYTILLRTQKGISNAEAIYFELKNTKFNFIVELFTHVDVQLASQKSFDCILSGTTCNIIFQFNKHLICCSVGDSRGILVYDKGQYMGPGILALSTDHKPDMPGEMERITMCGGEIDSLKDMYGNRIGPPRVFKLGSDYPGLAMSRSLGDLLGKEVGVSPVPQIIEYDIDFSTKYFVICSDGVWEFSSNEQVRDIGNMYYALNDVAGFCSQILKLAMDLWNQINFVRDDITIVSVFF